YFACRAPMVHAELDHRDTMRAAQTQKRQRQPDRVVEIAFGGEYVRSAEMLAQDRREDLLDRRLAVAADDNDDRNAESRAPVGRERLQRPLRIGRRNEIARDRRR